MTIYKIGNITVHIHGNVNQKNLEETTAKFFESCKKETRDEKRELYSLDRVVIAPIVA